MPMQNQATVTKTQVQDAITILQSAIDSDDPHAYPDEKIVLSGVIEDLEEFAIDNIEHRESGSQDFNQIPEYYVDKSTVSEDDD